MRVTVMVATAGDAGARRDRVAAILLAATARRAEAERDASTERENPDVNGAHEGLEIEPGCNRRGRA